VFNIKVGPADTEWDREETADREQSEAPTDFQDVNAFSPETPYAQQVNYPLYAPFSPPFEQTLPDPYQIHASFQMVSPYTTTPVYAGTPCTQINVSPQQAMFPFNTFENNAENTPMSPENYRSPQQYYATPMAQPNNNMSASESFALQMSPPEVSDIPVDYSGFEYSNMDYTQSTTQTDSSTMTTGYTNPEHDQGAYTTYENNTNFMYSQTYHDNTHQPPPQNTSTTDNGMYSHPHYPENTQASLEGSAPPRSKLIPGFSGFDNQLFSDHSDVFHPGHSVAQYQ
jgi:hypothetical protein